MDGTVTAYIYDMSPDDPLAHDDILLEFDTTAVPAILTRRWAHSDSVDEPLGFEAYNASGGAGTGTERAMFADRQGSVIWVTEPASGSVVAAYEYDGYGQLTQTQGTLVQPYGYTGREYDAESGLYYYRARNYDPAVGVFVQSDPIGFDAGQLNLTLYVGADPFGAKDPTGTVSFEYMLNKQHSESQTITGSTIVGTATMTATGLLLKMMAEMNFGLPPLVDTKQHGGNVPTSDCSDTVKDILQARVKYWEALANRCIPLEGKPAPSQILLVNELNLAKQRAFAKAAMAQATLNAACYRGGTGNHPAKLLNFLRGMDRCGCMVQFGPGYKKCVQKF